MNILNHEPWVANGGKDIGISNHVKMFSTIAPLMKMNFQASEPRGVDENQYFQHSEIQHQIYLPQSFMLLDIILNHLEALISSNVPNDFKEKVYYISKTKAPNSLLGTVIMVYQTPLYLVHSGVCGHIVHLVTFIILLLLLMFFLGLQRLISCKVIKISNL